MTPRRRARLTAAGTAVLGLAALAPSAASAAEIPVTTAANSGAGSLRAALTAAGANDVVVLPDPRTLATPATSYVLNGELDVAGAFKTIRGAGARQVTIDANQTGRVFHVQTGAALDLSGVTVTGGRQTAAGAFGGGIRGEMGTTLYLDRVVVRGNVVDVANDGGFGGGIAAEGTATISRSLIVDNVAKANGGNALGGGVWAGSTVGLYSTTVTGNSVVANGGTARGGGLATSGAAGNLGTSGATIARNRAEGAAGQGGNLAAAGTSGFALANSIVADGTGAGSTGNCWTSDPMKIGDAGGNVFAETAGCPAPIAFGSVLADPQLDTALRDNGGPTDTLRIAPTSAARDRNVFQGSYCSTTATDQRLFPRPAGELCDSGAYELTPPTAGAASSSAVGTSTATVSGAVDPNGPAGTAHVEYGTSPDALGSRTPDQPIAAGDGDVPVTAALTGLTGGLTHHYRVVVTTPDGTAASTVGSFTTQATALPGPGVPGGPGTPGTPGTPGGPGGPGTPAAPKAPVLSALKLAPKSWRTKKGARRGGRITFSLANGPAAVTFTVERSAPGKRKGKACVAPPRRGTFRRCTRFVAVKGSFSAKAGAGRVTWNGKVGGKALKQGAYRLVAVARTSAGASKPVRTTFRVR